MKNFEWVSVKERLPEKSGWYLVVDMENKFPFIYQTEFSKRWKRFYYSDCSNTAPENDDGRFHVTHWMDSPDLPVED